MSASKRLAGPDMNPVGPYRKVEAPLLLARLPDGRDKQIAAIEIAILNVVGSPVVFMMKKQRALHRKTIAGSLQRQRLEIWREVNVDRRHSGEMGENGRIAVELKI